MQTPEEGHPGKPTPFPLLIAASEAHVDVADAIFIGDMDVDYAAARGAGMRFLHAAWGYGPRPAGAAQLRTVAEIASLARFGTARASRAKLRTIPIPV